MDRKTACEILGIYENANKDDISRTYTMLLKKHRMSMQQGEDDGQQSDFEKINGAYNYLMGYRTQESEATGKTGKLSNFIYYNKIKLILLVIVLITVGYGIKVYTARRIEPDLKVAFVGSIYAIETDTFKDKVGKLIPDIKNPYVSTYSISQLGILETDMQNLQQFQVELNMGNLDVIIMDKANFENLVSLQVFANLDEFAGKIDMNEGLNNNLKVKNRDDAQEHLYGIDITDYSIFDDTGITGNQKIAVIRSNTKHMENARKFIDMLISSQM